jgi:hypothetical protein
MVLMKDTTPRLTQYYFLASLVLMLIDLTSLVCSSTYRNMLGIVDGRGALEYSGRMAPTVALFLFYAGICHRIFVTGKEPKRWMVIGQSIFFSFVAVMMCIPFVGYLSCLLTPIAVIYLSSILLWNKNWLLSWYYFSIALSIAFLVVNLLVGLEAARDSRK